VPFVNIQILAGHSPERKKEIARRVTEAISEVAEVPKDGVWVVFEDVAPLDWYISGNPVKKPGA
jgi:4-oxalocrotonate tautomerase